MWQVITGVLITIEDDLISPTPFPVGILAPLRVCTKEIFEICLDFVLVLEILLIRFVLYTKD